MYYVTDMGLGAKTIRINVTQPELEIFHSPIHGDCKKFSN